MYKFVHRVKTLCVRQDIQHHQSGCDAPDMSAEATTISRLIISMTATEELTLPAKNVISLRESGKTETLLVFREHPLAIKTTRDTVINLVVKAEGGSPAILVTTSCQMVIKY